MTLGVDADAASFTTLYRPVGRAELDLIRAEGYRAFPPRLPEQPIFYPVLNEQYATEIARDWNTRHNHDYRLRTDGLTGRALA